MCCSFYCLFVSVWLIAGQDAGFMLDKFKVPIRSKTAPGGGKPKISA